VKQGNEDEEDDGQDQGSNRRLDTEEPDETNQGQVHSSSCLLQSAGVYQALSVGFAVKDKQKVISIGQIDQVQPDCSETEDERRDDGVCNS